MIVAGFCRSARQGSSLPRGGHDRRDCRIAQCRAQFDSGRFSIHRASDKIVAPTIAWPIWLVAVGFAHRFLAM
jgi:hypothetical protein